MPSPDDLFQEAEQAIQGSLRHLDKIAADAHKQQLKYLARLSHRIKWRIVLRHLLKRRDKVAGYFVKRIGA